MKMTTVVWWWCCFRCVVTDTLICSEYLISGSYGVNDTALIASSVLNETVHRLDGGPRNARLFYPGDDLSTPARLGGWHSSDNPQDPFIQVTFPGDTIINAVTIQGRFKGANQWVKSYHLLYSMDGITWTTVTSFDGRPKLFVGSHDTNTPVTSEVTPNVKARHLRINPQSWQDIIVLRFDVSGCQTRKRNDGSQKFVRKSAISTEEMMSSQSVITSLSKVPSLNYCAFICYSHGTCVSYTYQTVDGIQRCTCYESSIVKPGCYPSEGDVFVNQDILDMYNEDQEAAMLYRIVEVRKSQADALITCRGEYTQLMRVDTTSKLTSLQNIINRYYVLRQDHRFYVSGVYSSGVWRYSGGTNVLESSLWSPGNPDPSVHEGHCVILTLTGLASVDCQQTLFSICGI